MDRDENRRENIRLIAQGGALQVVDDAGRSSDARLIDVSRSGLGFRSPIDLPIGAEVVVHPPEGSDLCALRLRIARRVVLNGDDSSDIVYGAAFADPVGPSRHEWFLGLRKAS